jgi:outer membrane protein
VDGGRGLVRSTLLAALAWVALSGAARAEPAAPPEPLTLTLEAAVELAMKENIDVALAELDLRAFQSRYREVIGAAISDLSLTGAYTRNFEKRIAFFSDGKTEIGERNSMVGGVEMEQPLYSGGKLRAGLKAAKLGTAAGEDALRSRRADVKLVVRSFFYTVLLASATASISEDTLRSAEAHLYTIRERYKQGLDSDLTVLRQEVEAANAKPALIQSRNLFELGLTSLKDVLGLDVDRPIIIDGRLDPPDFAAPSYESLVNSALAHNPDYQAARNRAEAALQLARATAGDQRPQLSLFGAYLWTAESPDFSPGSSQRGIIAAGGLRLRYPFFTGGEVLERVRQARIDHERALEVQRKTERTVRVEVKKQWLAAKEAEERARSQEGAIGQARRALDATEVRYKSGDASQLELNDATLALGRARTLYAQASHDFLVALAALERAAGTRLEEINR